MLLSLSILARHDDPGSQIVALVIFAVIMAFGAISQKMKKAAAEAERQRRRRIGPPAQPASMERPPVRREDVETMWPRAEVLRPPVPQPRRSIPQPTRTRTPPRPPEVAPERPQPIPSPRRLASGVEEALQEFEHEVQADLRGSPVSQLPARSLEQLRAAQSQKAGPQPGPVSFAQPTLSELRRAIVLNELLGPPLALRGEDSGP
jgi:hypothetical protein